MKQAMGQLGVGIMLTTSLLMGTGCGGTGKTVNLDLQQKHEASQFMETEPVRIVIESFEDRTYFNVAGGRPGDMIAQILADRLKTRGWKDRAWAVQVTPSGLTTNPNNADIVISGQLLDFSANAKSRLFSTVVTTGSKLVVTARNLVDQSSTTRSIEGAQRETLFWFSEDDVQELLAATLKDDIDRYLAETTIEHNTLRSTR